MFILKENEVNLLQIENKKKWARFGLIVLVIVIFIACYQKINVHYDPLSRYEYTTPENRELMLKYLSQKDINFVISQKLKPDDFMPYIEIEGFNVRNTVWYNRAKSYQEAENEYIVAFVNKYKDVMKKENFEGYLTNYTYESLETFFTDGDFYDSKAKLVLYPNALNTLIGNHRTLYRYVPKDLVHVTYEEIPMFNALDHQQPVSVRNEVKQPLLNMCNALQNVNGNSCGNMILVQGFVSYDQQVGLYGQALLDYGSDLYSYYTDQPGKSEFQLGYTVRFEVPKNDLELQMSEFQRQLDNNEIEEGSVFVSQQEAWLLENAHTYGFIVRYPQGKEETTGKYHQKFTLRYVGEQIASSMHEEGITLDEMVFEDE